jgi:hypothetical protein
MKNLKLISSSNYVLQVNDVTWIAPLHATWICCSGGGRLGWHLASTASSACRLNYGGGDSLGYTPSGELLYSNFHCPSYFCFNNDVTSKTVANLVFLR